MDSFKSHFSDHGATWRVGPGFTGCVCLHLDDIYGYRFASAHVGAIRLTFSSDCARVTGDYNYVQGWPGDDAIFMKGDDNGFSARPGADLSWRAGAGASRLAGDRTPRHLPDDSFPHAPRSGIIVARAAAARVALLSGPGD